MLTQVNHTETGVTLLEVYDQDNERFRLRIGKDRAEASYTKLLQSRHYVAQYLHDCCHREDIALAELMPHFIQDFCAWLSAERKLRGGTIWLTCQHLKGVVTRSYQRGLMSSNPFFQFYIPKNIRPREYLTEQELLTVMNHRFDRHELAFARDIFVFAAFTGLAYIDIKELTAEQVRNINGEYWIISRRHKTKVPFQVKMLAVPQQILAHYAHSDIARVPLFNMPKYRTLAKQVKQVISMCGISKTITMHCARHTFAIMALNHGVPIESVSRLLGHSNIKTTQIYAKITMQKLGNDMTELEHQLEKTYGIGRALTYANEP